MAQSSIKIPHNTGCGYKKIFLFTVPSIYFHGIVFSDVATFVTP